MRFRAVPAIAAVLLTAACASTAPAAAPATSPSVPAAVPIPTASSSPSTSPSTSAAPTQKPQLHVAIAASRLPYRPAAGAPKLGDVSVLTGPSDPCAIPADDSGDEGQLINAQMDVNVLIVTFEFTNPCSKPLTYSFTVTQELGSATGPAGGDPVETTTQPIAAGQSVTMNVNVDPKATLTAAQLQDLWVGITHITKQPGY